ncbi:hypothetical protein O1L68_01030 [Streptomyces lydicus]|nr:hypothetical protein [Streptomyces lydicus]
MSPKCRAMRTARTSWRPRPSCPVEPGAEMALGVPEAEPAGENAATELVR